MRLSVGSTAELKENVTVERQERRFRRSLLPLVFATGALLAACTSPAPATPGSNQPGSGPQQQSLPAPGATTVARIALPTADASAPATTPTFANYFGTVTIDGEPAGNGLVVEVFTPGGVLAGRSATVDGWYPYTRVFGAYSDTASSIPGAKEGEPVVFKVNGRQAATAPSTVTWKSDPAPVRVDLTVPGN